MIHTRWLKPWARLTIQANSFSPPGFRLPGGTKWRGRDGDPRVDTSHTARRPTSHRPTLHAANKTILETHGRPYALPAASTKENKRALAERFCTTKAAEKRVSPSEYESEYGKGDHSTVIIQFQNEDVSSL